ncbi:MAG: ABC transporter ATP-binding protein [Halanaerobiales bacterium]
MRNFSGDKYGLAEDVLLSVEDLHTYFYQEDKVVKAVNGISFEVKKNTAVGIVGESGSGKSVTVRSLINLLPGNNGKIEEGTILFRLDNNDVVNITDFAPHGKEMQNIRGNEIAMIFQEPMSAFNTIYTIGMQIGEVFRFHTKMKKKEIEEEIIKLLDDVNLPNPRERIKNYPFQLSGGMCQRAMIAMALAARPRLLICDEPTTALDVTVQEKILYLIEKINEKFDASILYITHDLAVVSELVDEIVVMYLGKILEYGKVRDIFNDPLHPYTRLLLKSIPVLGRKQEKLEIIAGSIPGPDVEISGCVFATRCPEAKDICRQKEPSTILKADRKVACWLYT